ncbi:deaminated glutathione amidase-like isoform X4 [Manacus candei]|uniref:deaminated glutathione amidase-like isoform X4 n=1 Tax=Manacus candei TaxID=415023 RepID=UPI0022279A62|nr:deaminated glutathione amidase-like isoform X4 [Manacus candei]
MLRAAPRALLCCRPPGPPQRLPQRPPRAPQSCGTAGRMSVPPRATVAVAQVTSTPDKEHNWCQCSALVREAAGRGARLVFLPEGFDFIGHGPEQSLSLAEPLDGHTVGRYRQLARECDVWLSLGGFHERGSDWDTTGRIYNCHILLDSSGSLVSTYRKTHLFDVDLPGGPSLRESGFTNPGPAILPPVDTPVGKLGLAVCYDLRFPELALALRAQGAQILAYPSAFTVPTGAAHWEVLLRARAIECQCYVVAAAQTGRHHEARVSFGHSLVADPWGTVVAQCHEGPGLCLADIDLEYLQRVRRDLPVQGHRRRDLYGCPGAPGPQMCPNLPQMCPKSTPNQPLRLPGGTGALNLPQIYPNVPQIHPKSTSTAAWGHRGPECAQMYPNVPQICPKSTSTAAQGHWGPKTCI